MEIIRRSPVGSRQGGRSKTLLFTVIAVAMAAAAGYVLQIARQPASSLDMPESGFDLSYVPPGSSASAARVPQQPKSSLVGVLGGGSLAAQNAAPAASASAAAPAAGPAGFAQTAADIVRNGVETTKQWAGMLASPAKFLVGETKLGSAGQLRAFLSHPASVERYAYHPLVREVLNSPKLVGLLLRPSVARAFVGSPAMGDDSTVDALLKSPLVAQILRSPGVQQAMSDDADAVNAIVGDPEVAKWLGKHPSATAALGQVNPAFSALSMMNGAAPAPR